MKFNFGKTFRFYALTGPYISYALDGRYFYDPPYGSHADKEGKIIFQEFTIENSKEGKCYDPEYYNRIDAGLYIGGGVGGNLGYGSLYLDVRFGLGFIDYHKTENFTFLPEGYEHFNTRAINISLAYYLPVIKIDGKK